ncbi:MAG: hypothetical protein LBK27_00665 [Treponema sp.]|jgi:hypothetical protein|nr:hypothetical protein [Treponema sp.]
MNKLVLFCVSLIPALPLHAQSGGDFNWFMALLNQKGGVSVSVEKPMPMETGDILNFYIKSEAGCYFYLAAQTSDNEVVIIHAGPLKTGEELQAGPVQLTNPGGTETFFFVMTMVRQRKLERAINAYTKKPGSIRAGRAVLNEIFALRRELSRLDEKPEQPVYLGGAFRTVDSAVEGMMFSGAGIYVKTLNISH